MLRWNSPTESAEGFECYLEVKERIRSCRHLGEPVEGEGGKTLTVKCDCGTSAAQPVYRCPIKGRCLPELLLVGSRLRVWESRKPESDIYQACLTCDEHELER